MWLDLRREAFYILFGLRRSTTNNRPNHAHALSLSLSHTHTRTFLTGSCSASNNPPSLFPLFLHQKIQCGRFLVWLALSNFNPCPNPKKVTDMFFFTLEWKFKALETHGKHFSHYLFVKSILNRFIVLVLQYFDFYRIDTLSFKGIFLSLSLFHRRTHKNLR